jgi:hypothetical protein
MHIRAYSSFLLLSAIQEKIHSLDLVLCNMNLGSCADSWFSFLKGETIDLPGNLPVCSYVREKVCSC